MIKSLALLVMLTACTAPQTEFLPILPPETLLTAVPAPEIPDPKTATQKTVALYLIEQQQALTLCNTQLQILQDWRASWTLPTTPHE